MSRLWSGGLFVAMAGLGGCQAAAEKGDIEAALLARTLAIEPAAMGQAVPPAVARPNAWHVTDPWLVTDQPAAAGDVIYADVGTPVGASQSAATSRPAAVSPEYPQPTATAARTAPTTFYDQFKKDLYKTTGTKYIISLDFTDQQILDAPGRGFNRGVARFDFGIDQDLWKGAQLSLDARGGTGNGIDPLIHNGVNTNQFETPGAPIFIMRLAFYQSLFENKLVVRVGKFDISDFIDYNRFGSYNFLAYSFAHNMVLPLPGNTLGAMFTLHPTDWLTFQSGFSNVDQTPTESGFNSFGRGEYLQLNEVALLPKFFGQDGSYRFMGWYDNRTADRPDGRGSESGRGGFALSFDQNITGKFGLFCRYGYSDQQILPNVPVQYWSAGFLWTGPLQARPLDTLAVGILQNCYGTSHRFVTANSSAHETLLEAYYQYELNPYTSVVPTFQYVGSPGGTDRKGEFIAGIHVNLHL